MRGLILVVLLAVSPAVALSSAAKDFYQQVPGIENITVRSATPPVVVTQNGDTVALVNSMWERGFVLIGYSGFSGQMSKRSSAISWGKKIGASHIFFTAEHQSTQTNYIPFSTPTASTTYSNGTASAYGSGGYAYGNYSGTSTTYGSQTSYIPLTVSRYAQTITYFAPVRPGGTGMMLEPLTDAQRRSLGTNRAQAVRAVRVNSPAYDADIMPGDILMEVDSLPASIDNLIAAQNKAGEHVYKLNRVGALLEKTVSIAVPR